MIDGNAETGREDAAGEMSGGRGVGRVTRSARGRPLRPRLAPDSGGLTAIRPGQVKITAAANGVTSGANVLVSLREVA